MPEARLERTRALYREACNHYFMFLNRSDIAPDILPNGDRRTTEICFNCGLRRYYDRSQEEFKKELDSLFTMPLLEGRDAQ